MEVVAGAALNAFFQTMLTQLSSSELLKFARQKHVEAQLKRWESILRKIRAVLDDAEEKQARNKSVEVWLRELEVLVYDMEDVLDEFTSDALQHNLVVEEAHTSSSRIRRFIATSKNAGLRTSAAMSNLKLGAKIKDMTSRLEDIMSTLSLLSLTEGGGRSNISRGRSSRNGRQVETSLNDSFVYGRDDDKQAVLDLLRGEGTDAAGGVLVIPIQGMGGMGKTTLARLVYCDAQVKDFELKAWACVSDSTDVCSITRLILSSMHSELRDSDDLNTLQVKLKEKLSQKKFLIVLDDVWEMEYREWTNLCKPFQAGLPGSAIIITTRDGSISSKLGTVLPYLLKEVSYDHCLSIFARHALGAADFSGHPNLKSIAIEIVRKCKGLPLAAEALGGMLRNSVQYEEWEEIAESEIWDLPHEEGGILPALRLSYHHLPSHLKQCFAYCSIFPKDYEFDRDELVLLWMAEGFLQLTKGKKEMEDLGAEYFSDLLSRSFFQPSTQNSGRFVMHDLLNDLATCVAGDTCFNLDAILKSSKRFDPSELEKARHSSFIPSKYEVSQRFDCFSHVRSLRTFLPLPVSALYTGNFISVDVLNNLMLQLKRLRSLSLSGYEISELPASVGELKHLRYLNLSKTKIKWLPECVCSLLKLQTLLLRDCRVLENLPAGIGNLSNLRHLDISGTPSLKEMPAGIACLTGLQGLTKFMVGGDDRLSVGELKHHSHLRGKLSISGLHNVESVQEAVECNLRHKQGLDELEMEWSHSVDEGDALQVLHSLQPHSNLKSLMIKSYCGSKFPPWIASPSSSNIVKLNLHDCRKVTSLPSLGRLSLLKELWIRGMDAVKTVEFEFYGSLSPFPSLEILRFEDMPEWQSWFCSHSPGREVEIEFPCLRELSLLNCPQLVGNLPRQLPYLKSLKICRCPVLAEGLVSLPSLCTLTLEVCNEALLRGMNGLTSLTTLRISEIAKLTSLHEGLVHSLVALEVLVIERCRELKSLWNTGAEVEKLACLKRISVKVCPKLVSFSTEDHDELPNNLQYLELAYCDNLEKLPCMPQYLASLEKVIIEACPKLGSMVDLPDSLRYLKLENCDSLQNLPPGLHNLTSLQEMSIRKCPKLRSINVSNFPCRLRRLKLWDCDEVAESLLNGMMIHGCSENSCLIEDLELKRCHSLTDFPRGRLPSTLRRLTIAECRKLESMPEGVMQSHSYNDNNSDTIQELEIIDCPSLGWFPADKLPAKRLVIRECAQLDSLLKSMLHNNKPLEYVEIYNCTNLKGFPDCLHSLMNLTSLCLRDCHALVSFPQRGLPISNFKSLHIYNCKNLMALPNNMHSLTYLQDLVIEKCSAIKYLPAGGFPPNLTSLKIKDCKDLQQPMSEWGMHKLTSLQDFLIDGLCPPDLSTFPRDEHKLPKTVTSISIRNIKHMKILSPKGFQNLTCLKELSVFNCPVLQKLPKEFPPSLEQLSIEGCPALQQKCLQGKGKYWRAIAPIPCISIND